MDEKEISQLLELVSRKWTQPVLDELAKGIRSHNDLARAIKADHQQMARVLRPLVHTHLVYRKVHTATPPVRVYYSLTPRGKTIAALYSEFRVSVMMALADAV